MIEIKKSIEQGFGRGGLYDILKQLQNQMLLTPTKVYYVHKGGNGQGGLSWETAYPTLTEAITEQRRMRALQPSAEQSVDAYIIMAPGTYDEAITTFPFSTTIIGLGVPGTDKSTEIIPTAGSAMAGTVSGLTLVNLRFECAGAVDVLDFNICNNVSLIGCDIQCNTDNVNAISTQNSSYLTIRNSKIGRGGLPTFACGMYFDGGGDNYLIHAVIENNIITGLDATGKGIYIAANCNADQAVIRNNIIKLTGAGIGIDDDSDVAMLVGNNIFTIAGTWADCNTNLAINNWHNNGTTVTNEPNMPT